MRGCLSSLVGNAIFLIVLGVLAAPFVVAAATAALPVLFIIGFVWLAIKGLTSPWYRQSMAKARAEASMRAHSASPKPSASPRQSSDPFDSLFDGFFPNPAPSAAPPQGVVGHASGKRFRVYEVDPNGARLQNPLLYAEEYDDGRMCGFAVYGGQTVGVTILSTAEFDRRFRRWVE